MGSDNPFANPIAAANKKKVAKNKFPNPVGSVDRRKSAKATGQRSAYHGQKVQWTFRIPDELKDEIIEWANEFGITQTAMKQWLLERGIVALRDGETPEMEQVVKKSVKPLID